MMTKVLVTGSSGFVGKNLCENLRLDSEIELLTYDRTNNHNDLVDMVKQANFIYHLAGVNRPNDEKDFTKYNVNLTNDIVSILQKHNKKTPILLTSSIQALLDNPYGKSKMQAENILTQWHELTGSNIYIYRLPGVFGKWCRPNYNSVVATFCNNIAKGLPIEISNKDHELSLVYIDDVIKEFIKVLKNNVDKSKSNLYEIPTIYSITLGKLAEIIYELKEIRDTLIVPDLSDLFVKYLYSTYVSYLNTDDYGYDLNKNEDDRGWLAEFIKSKQFGQIFISVTKPGISRGNHWHNTKIEKFLVIDGEADITFRNKIDSQKIISYKVSGDKLRVIDIPTGYVHAIKNIGKTNLTTLFWANELLNKEYHDTYFEEV